MSNRAILLSVTAIVISLVAISASIFPLIAAKEESNLLTTTVTPSVTTTVTPSVKVGTPNVISTISTSDAANTIVVSGIGVVKAKPDTVKISMGVFTEETEVQAAVEKNAAIFQSILSALDGVGIAKDSMETVSYTISPVYEYPQNSKPILTGYRVDHQIMVTVLASDLDQLGTKAGKVIDAAFSAGANELNNIAFTVSDTTAKDLTKQARILAVADASDKAKTIADGLGVKITGVQQAIESSGYYAPSVTVNMAGAEMAKASTEILPGSLSISVSVQVYFLIG
jgi:uncharacterized protein YggE